jgi:hypothetical protein
VDADKVLQAARFFAALNTESAEVGRQLVAASDACFSPAEHVVQWTADREIIVHQPRPVAIARAWCSPQSSPLDGWRRANASLRPLTVPDQWRCLSPSDFGFHNALLRPSGEIASSISSTRGGRPRE